jgi:hypothetical protein
MPQLPGLPTDEREFRKNTSKQYEALGRFVECFELMVNEVRECSIDLVAHDENNRGAVSIAFHHHALSAMPLIEIFRAVGAKVVGLTQVEIDDLDNDEDPFISADSTDTFVPEEKRVKFKASDRDAFSAIMKRIMAEYKELSETRNALLHGTWFVGYGSRTDPNASTFRVRKYQTTKIGLTPVEGLPKSAPELITLAQRCDDTRNWIGFLASCLAEAEPFNERFVQERGDWLLILGPSKTPLPRKPPEQDSPNPNATDTP